jgi:hypothetical protein
LVSQKINILKIKKSSKYSISICNSSYFNEDTNTN